MGAKGKEGRAILVHVMETYGKQAVHLHLFLMSAFTIGRGELHTLAALPFGKQAPSYSTIAQQVSSCQSFTPFKAPLHGTDLIVK